MIFLPSGHTRVRFPTISVGKTRSSKILSWTEVNVRDMGRGCFWRLLRPGLRIIRRCPINTTWRSENFFSSSRVNLLVTTNIQGVNYRCWILLKEVRRGIGTKITIAFFPLETSSCTIRIHNSGIHTSLAELNCNGLNSFLKSGTLVSRS